MRKAAHLAAALALSALAAPVLHAQELAEMCRAASDVKVGQWSSYDVTGGNPGQMRFAIVGSERVGDSTLVWFEIGFTSKDPTHSGIMQILVPGFGVNASSIHGFILKSGNQPAMRMPRQMIGMMFQQAAGNNYALDFAKRCATGQVVGWESVTVPAGTIRALHVKSENGTDEWAARDIPFGLVKTHAKDGSEIALTGRGAGAKSSITEAPQEMPMPGMMKKP